MSFSFLPWPVYVILIGGIGLALTLHVIRSMKDFPILFRIGLGIYGIGAILAALVKFVKHTGILDEYYSILYMLAMSSNVGLPLFIIGGFQRSKNNPDPVKKRKSLLSLYMLTATSIAWVSIIAYVIITAN